LSDPAPSYPDRTRPEAVSRKPSLVSAPDTVLRCHKIETDRQKPGQIQFGGSPLPLLRANSESIPGPLTPGWILNSPGPDNETDNQETQGWIFFLPVRGCDRWCAGKKRGRQWKDGPPGG